MVGSTTSLLSVFGISETVSASKPLEGIGAWIDSIGAIVTVLAALVAGVWAYFKLVKGRTYRPRLEIELEGQWLRIDDRPLLVARIAVTNIGQSNVNLYQYGTGLKVKLLAAEQPPPPDAMSWEQKTPTYEVLKHHQWIEPGETVKDELLIDLDIKDPAVTLFECRVVFDWRRRRIAVLARQIVVPEDHASTKQGQN